MRLCDGRPGMGARCLFCAEQPISLWMRVLPLLFLATIARDTACDPKKVMLAAQELLHRDKAFAVRHMLG